MKILCAILCTGTCLLVAARAEDLTTLSGRIYTNVEIRQIEPDGLTFRHDGGATKILFPDLPEEIQQRYGYNPRIAARYQRCTAAAQKRAEKKQGVLQLQGEAAGDSAAK
jgi:hypothetical protein